MKRIVWIILLTILAVNAAGVVYTFVQPRYEATIQSVGPAGSVTRSTRHGSRSHTVVPLVVTYTDGDGQRQTAEVTCSRPSGLLTIGQRIVIVRNFSGGFIPYPFTGLRLFCGSVCAGLGLFLFFMWIDRDTGKGEKQARKRAGGDT